MQKNKTYIYKLEKSRNNNNVLLFYVILILTILETKIDWFF